MYASSSNSGNFKQFWCLLFMFDYTLCKLIELPRIDGLLNFDLCVHSWESPIDLLSKIKKVIGLINKRSLSSSGYKIRYITCHFILICIFQVKYWGEVWCIYVFLFGFFSRIRIRKLMKLEVLLMLTICFYNLVNNEFK